jgi:hypothetical protein
MKVKRFNDTNENNSTTGLLQFRLFDSNYGPNGNPRTLSVYLRTDDATIGYSFYGGWQDSGMGFAISNLQLQESLPSSIKGFSIKTLENKIRQILSTGVGSNDIKKVEVLNDIPKKSDKDTIKIMLDKLSIPDKKEILDYLINITTG